MPFGFDIFNFVKDLEPTFSGFRREIRDLHRFFFLCNPRLWEVTPRFFYFILNP